MAWAEWNGRYRDVIRRFVRGDPGLVGQVCTCLAGSADLYESDGRLPTNSINFVTCHDGFTLRDLVSYETKHNEANGEDNRDGSNDNLSWNCGAEGETDDPSITGLRLRQARNIMAILLLSQGVPMILAGDEMLRTQRGNNNAFCQDNAVSWIDWRMTGPARDMLRFVRELIALRKRHASLRRHGFFTGRPAMDQMHADVAWHGERLNEPAWYDPNARFAALTLAGQASGESMLHLIFNMNDDARVAALPVVEKGEWRRIVDTAAASPLDIVSPTETAPAENGTCRVEARSVVVLESSC